MMQGPTSDRALERERKLQEERTLEELQIKSGDWLDVAVMLPVVKADASGRPGTNGAHGNVSGSGLHGTPGWGGLGTGGNVGVGSTPAPRATHWRGGAPSAPVALGRSARRGSGADDFDGPSRGRGGGFAGRGRGNAVPLNRRGMPRRGSPDRTLGGTGPKRARSRSRSASRSRSRSRSRSPPRRRRSRSLSASPIRD